MNITVGADPEFFLKSNSGNISAHDLVPGTKNNPHKLFKGAVQADGTAVEFNIDPAYNASEFSNSIETVLTQIRAMVPNELMFEFTPAVRYEESYFDTLPEFSKELGCDPDFNAYSGRANPRPIPKDNYKTMRTGAGHLHIGFNNVDDPMSQSHMWDCRTLVMKLDEYFRLFEPRWDSDKERRSLYGNIGAFRPKKYGVEYRVLSNAWLKYPKLWPWLFDSCVAITKYLEETGNSVRTALIGSDFYKYYDIEDAILFRSQYHNKTYQKEVYEKLDKLVEKANKKLGIGLPVFPQDFVKEN